MVIRAVQMAIWQRQGSHPVILHSDRGSQFRSGDYQRYLTANGLVCSMSAVGHCGDNAACEGFFGRLKTEMFYPCDWKTASIEQFTQALDSYIRWYNEKRIKITLGYLSPIEYRESLGLTA